jgi:predicted HD phosphohydrolase
MNPPQSAAPRVFSTVDELIHHLEDLAVMTSVESRRMTELDHGLQTAELLRHAAPDDVELQIAGLIHDLAHPWDIPGQPDHAHLGAESIEELLGERIASLIVGHVPAKRYLVATHDDYLELLSPDSVVTLDAQGGAMTPDEVAVFESDVDCQAMVRLRLADDAAKVPGAQVPNLGFWEPTLRGLARRA